jgi:hypothetical protein
VQILSLNDLQQQASQNVKPANLSAAPPALRPITRLH